MSVLTVLLAAIFFAAWKAPRWVKEIGSFALAFGILEMVISLLQMFDAMSRDGSIPQVVIAAGLKVTLIPLIYGIIIYLVSLVVRVLQKPRL